MAISNPIPGPQGPSGATGPAGPAPSGTGYAHVTSGVLDQPATASIPQSDVTGLTTSLAGKASTAHHATHETGGSDAMTALAGGVITTGTVADARLSTNVPLLNVHNFFSAPIDTPSLGINGPGSSLIFIDSTAALNQKAWRFKQEGGDGVFRVEALTDDLLTLQSTPISVSRNSDVNFTGKLIATRANTELRLTAPDQPANGRVWQILNTATLLVFRASDDALNQQAVVYIDRNGVVHAPSGFSSDTPINNAVQEWFPIIGGDISETGQVYNYQQGRYIKTGKQVTVWAYTQFSNKGTITGNLVIKNFPFPIGNPGGTNPPPFTAGTVSYYTNLFTPQDVTGLSCRGLPTQSYAEMFKFLSQGNNPVKMTGADVNNTSQFIISMTYFID